MSYTNFQNNVTPANDTTLNQMQIGLMQLVFPIGSTYITQTDTNPNTILNFGTWERIKGKVLVGLDEDDTEFNTIGKNGGEKEHTLTIEELARHAHTTGIMTDSGINAESGQSSATVVFDQSAGTYSAYTGNDKPHNNLQPYEVVGYMWIRRA